MSVGVWDRGEGNHLVYVDAMFGETILNRLSGQERDMYQHNTFSCTTSWSGNEGKEVVWERGHLTCLS